MRAHQKKCGDNKNKIDNLPRDSGVELQHSIEHPEIDAITASPLCSANATALDDDILPAALPPPPGSIHSAGRGISALDSRHADILQAAHDGDLTSLQRVSDEEDESVIRTAVCTSGCSALHWAAGNNQLPILQYLLSPRQRKTLQRRTRNGNVEQFKPNESSGSNANDPDGVDELSFSLPHQHLVLPPLFDDVNVRATGPSKGRTPLHYAARNGCLEAVQVLLEVYQAHPNPHAKQNVTPLQMAVWRNQLSVCQYLIQQWQVYHPIHNPQINDFQCNLAHWACICPIECAGPNGQDLIPLMQYLKELGVNFHARQKQGHTPLHKASWLGHLSVVKWLHEQCDAWDDTPDHAGNYCVDLCRMARTSRHDLVEQHLRHYCSRQVQDWCLLLNVTLEEVRIPIGVGHGNQATTGNTDFMVNVTALRKAFLQKVRQVHPDRHYQEHGNVQDDFYQLQVAYHNLLHFGGKGTQCNAAHQLPLLLKQHGEEVVVGSSPVPPPCTATTTTELVESVTSQTRPTTDTNIRSPSSINEDESNQLSSNDDNDDDDRFKAQLLTVLQEYGTKGMDVSNIKKKWQQVWGTSFPDTGKNVTLSRYLSLHAGDVLAIYKSKHDKKVMVHARHHLASKAQQTRDESPTSTIPSKQEHEQQCMS